MSSESPVVITGVGIISPIGLSLESFWESLLQKRSGVKVRDHFASSDQPFRISAEISDFEPKKFVRPRKALKVMCRPIQLGFAASMLAAEHAAIEGQIDPERFATVFGSEAFYADPLDVSRVFRQCIIENEYQHDRWGDYAMSDIEPLWMLKYLPNMVASHISIACDARAASNTICQAEASSLLALIEAADLIHRGAADAVMVGATGSMMAATGMVFRGLHRLSQNIQSPEAALRPFDAQRDGMVVGEGAGAMVLERESSALARGATPLARIKGSCRSFCPDRSAMPEAIAENMNQALTRAGMTAVQIGHVNANGYSTVDDDICEAQAIHKVFGQTPVIAPKGTFGNLGPSTGLVELAASIKAGIEGVLPPIMNLEQIDERCAIQAVVEPQNNEGNSSALSMNFTESGQIVSMVIDR